MESGFRFAVGGRSAFKNRFAIFGGIAAVTNQRRRARVAPFFKNSEKSTHGFMKNKKENETKENEMKTKLKIKIGKTFSKD